MVAPYTYPDCASGRAYSEGDITITRQWISSGPNDPPPFKQWVKHTVGMSHWIDDGHTNNHVPAGTAECSLGTPSPDDPYEVVAYSLEDTRSGTVTFHYHAKVDVTCGPNSQAMAYIAVNADVGVSHPVPGAQIAKVSPANYRAMPWYPASLRRVTSYANCPPGDPVNVATGEHIYSPNPDINVYSPYGPEVTYQRNYLSTLASDGKHSMGLPIGWNDGFDVKFVAQTPTSWGDLKLVYPNDAEEVATPVILGGTPTGQFTVPSGSDYIVTGVPSTTVGQWNQLTITHKDRMQWRFSPVSSDTYMLSAIVNRMSRSINIVRDSQNGNRITTIQDDQASPVTLLSFSYEDGYLSLLTDCFGRKVSYGYQTNNGVTCLTSVSQLSTAGSAPARSTYGYYVTGSPSVPHLTSVSVPSPTGSWTSTENFVLDSWGKISSIVDANGNIHAFQYSYPDATEVIVKTSTGKVEQDLLVSFDINHSNVVTSITDRNGCISKKEYTDSNNPFLPTKITDKLNKTVETTYDQYGNVITVKSARGTVTRYVYDYDVFPLGRLRTVKEADNLAPDDPAKKPDTSVSYYEPSGLVQSITYPKPGTTGPDGDRVTTSYTYDLVDDQNAGTRGLGNILSVTNPGNNAAASITTTYNYGPYAQVKLGLPWSITDNLGHCTFFEYDARGNRKSATDALGNKVNYIFNIADQVTNILHPHTAPVP